MVCRVPLARSACGNKGTGVLFPVQALRARRGLGQVGNTGTRWYSRTHISVPLPSSLLKPISPFISST